MKTRYRGNSILITIEPGDSTIVELVEGYSFERIHITNISNIWGIYETAISNNQVLTFPPVKSKSPYILQINTIKEAEKAILRFDIEKFGQIPDPHYFDKNFEPILVPGDDGNAYPVIPSDQFK